MECPLFGPCGVFVFVTWPTTFIRYLSMCYVIFQEPKMLANYPKHDPQVGISVCVFKHTLWRWNLRPSTSNEMSLWRSDTTDLYHIHVIYTKQGWVQKFWHGTKTPTKPLPKIEHQLRLGSASRNSHHLQTLQGGRSWSYIWELDPSRKENKSRQESQLRRILNRRILTELSRSSEQKRCMNSPHSTLMRDDDFLETKRDREQIGWHEM